MNRLFKTELFGYVWAVAAFALAETVQFMVSTSEVVSPTAIYLGLVSKVAVMAAVYRTPSLLERLRDPRVAAVVAVLLAGSVVVVNIPSGPVALGVASVAFYGCEMAILLAAGDAIFRTVSVKGVAPAALGGVLVAFALALVLFSLPEPAAFVLKVAVAGACGFFPAVRFGRPYAPDRGGSRGEGGGRVRIPAALAISICFYILGIQVSYMSFWEACDWSSAYALAVVVSLGVLIAEFGLLRASRISLIDLVSASLVAIPSLFAGAGLGEASILVALASIGFYIFIPRVFQVAASAAEEGGENPVRLLVQAELVLSVGEVVSTWLVGIAPSGDLDPALRFSCAVVVATGCILSAFALYEARTRDLIYGLIGDDALALVDGAGLPLPSDASGIEPDLAPACQAAAAEWHLTEREAGVLELLVAGCTLGEVCERTVVSMSTVKSHVYHIYQKMGVHSRGELVEAVKAVVPDERAADCGSEGESTPRG